MSFFSRPETFEHIRILTINLTNENNVLEEKNEDFAFEVEDLKKTNKGFNEEISTIKIN